MLVLSGDIGGTTTRIQLTDFKDSGDIKIIKSIRYSSGDYANFMEIITAFFFQTDIKLDNIAGACFGVAGPITDGVVKCTNLPWVIKVDDIKDQLKHPPSKN